jgi:hypothetical protein
MHGTFRTIHSERDHLGLELDSKLRNAAVRASWVHNEASWLMYLLTAAPYTRDLMFLFFVGCLSNHNLLLARRLNRHILR